MKKPLLSPEILLLCLVFFMTAFFISNRFFRGDPAGWKQIVTSDGRGYYAYLPAILIDHDLTYRNVIETEKSILGFREYQPGYLVKSGNSVFNKYFAGEALLLLPFFLLAMFFTYLFGADMSGYSFFFQAFAGIGALFYLLAGLWFLVKILRTLHIRDSVSGFVILAILFGTNLFYYTLWQPTMSHVYSFFAINGFLWFVIRSMEDFSRRNALPAGLFLGLVILIRPTNGVILLLIPFFFNDLQEMKGFFLSLGKKVPEMLIFILAAVIVFSIQPLLWYLQTGHFLLWSYKDEGFRFMHPEFRSVLLSFRKGLFIYTPLVFLAVIGIAAILKKPVRLISMLVFLLGSTYIIASWWNWYYGDGFGLRAFIDYYGIYALLIALLLNRMKPRFEKIFMTLLFAPFILLSLFQTWQYCNYIIHPYSMTPVKYRYVFLKSDSVYMNCLGGNQELPGYTVDPDQPCHSTVNTFDTVAKVWNYAEVCRVKNAPSGKYVNIIDSVHCFSAGYMIRADQITKIPARYYMKISMMVYDSMPGASNRTNLVFSMDSINFKENFYQSIRLNDIPLNPPRKWRSCYFSLTLPEILNPEGILKIYIWNTGRKTFLLDDFRIDFYPDHAGEE